MPIQVLCTGCQAKLKAPDTAGGKRIRCPKCQTVVSVPSAAGGSAASDAPAPAGGSEATRKQEQWFLQTPDGSQYGPVARGELDQWYSEGRVSVECQILKEGSTQWQWAAELFPSLASTTAHASPASPAPLPSSPALSNEPFASTAAGPSPLTPLSPANAFADPFSSPLGAAGSAPFGSATTSAATLPSSTSNPLLATGGYGQSAGSPNPYSPSTLGPGYGAYPQRTGPHPMVIVAGIFHILMGCWNAFNCLLGSVGALALMAIGGAAGAAGANNPDPGAEGGMATLAAFGVLGGVVVFVISLLFLTYGVVQVFTAIGLFQRKRWARTSTFTIASLGTLAMLIYLGLVIMFFDIGSMIALLGEIIYVPILFLAMLLPDSNRGFR